MAPVRAKLPDPEFAAIPAPRRRYLWELGADLERTNWWLFVTCSLLLGCTLLLAAVVAIIFSRPPLVLTDDQGYVSYRSTEVFRLDELRIKTYVELIMTRLLNMNPGVYDLGPIALLASPKVVQTYTDHAYSTAQDRVRVNERRYFSFTDVKRFIDNKFPDLIVLAVRGEMAYFREGENEPAPGAPSNLTSLASIRAQSQTVTYLMYLEQRRPTPPNPWGLMTVGLAQQQGDEAKAIWDAAIPLYSTVLPDGTVISAINQQDMQARTQQDISRKKSGVSPTSTPNPAKPTAQ